MQTTADTVPETTQLLLKIVLGTVKPHTYAGSVVVMNEEHGIMADLVFSVVDDAKNPERFRLSVFRGERTLLDIKGFPDDEKLRAGGLGAALLAHVLGSNIRAGVSALRADRDVGRAIFTTDDSSDPDCSVIGMVEKDDTDVSYERLVRIAAVDMPVLRAMCE